MDIYKRIRVVAASGPIFTRVKAHVEAGGVELRRVPWMLSRLEQGGWFRRRVRPFVADCPEVGQVLGELQPLVLDLWVREGQWPRGPG